MSDEMGEPVHAAQADQGQGQAMWGGRFRKPPHELVEAFGASVTFDRRLAPYDIQGSVAHARMLGKRGIIAADEAAAIIAGLEQVRAEIETGGFVWRREFEDVHMNIERRLTELIGPAGGKLHTGRSRNDQVALDMHLYAREAYAAIGERLRELALVLVRLAEDNLDVVMPGYTHLQRAQPVLFAHHMLAYAWMFERDRSRFADARVRADCMPLGAGALAGTTFPIDREMVARELGFSKLYENSMDAVSDRDYLIEGLAAASIVALHLSRLSEELILWTSEEFHFIELDDAFTTGSSIMPQKKNPDVAELVRGKTGRVYGHLLALLTTCKGLPLAYNKDMQEDKEGVFDAFDTVQSSIEIFAAMLSTLTVQRTALAAAVRRDFSAATDMADYLVEKGVPFRQAHEVVGRVVRHCIDRGIPLTGLGADELSAFSDRFKPDVLARLSPESVVAARAARGGTAPSAVIEQLDQIKRLLQT